MELQHDDVWDIFTTTKTFQDYQNNFLQEGYVKEEVPEAIKEGIRVVKKLLLMAYYEHRFLDVAFTQMAFLLEKTMRQRVKDFKVKLKKYDYVNFIDWFHENGYFETDHKSIIDFVRTTRNDKVHKIDAGNFGTLIINPIYWAIDWINDLYEDRGLRKQRKEELFQLKTEISRSLVGGKILSVEGKRYIINTVYPNFINNKNETKELDLIVVPIYDLSYYDPDKIFIPPIMEFAIRDWSLTDSIFKGVDIATGKELSVSNISDAKNKLRYSKWNEQLLAIENNPFIGLEIMKEADKRYLRSLRRLYRS